MIAAASLPTSDPDRCFVDVAGRRLAYTDEGPPSAPAFIAIHGSPGSVRDFRYLAPQVSAAVRFVRVDLPGCGESEPGPAVHSLERRAECVLALADALSLDRVGLIGHSMGSGTALATAAASPDRVDSLIAICGMGLRRHRGLGLPPWVFGLFARLLPVPIVGHLLLPLSRRSYSRRGFAGVETWTRHDFGVQYGTLSAADFAAMRRFVAAPLPPVIVAYSRDDHMIETRISEELAAAIPNARVLAFDTGGHNLQKTRAPEIGRVILELAGR